MLNAIKENIKGLWMPVVLVTMIAIGIFFNRCGLQVFQTDEITKGFGSFSGNRHSIHTSALCVLFYRKAVAEVS